MVPNNALLGADSGSTGVVAGAAGVVGGVSSESIVIGVCFLFLKRSCHQRGLRCGGSSISEV